MSSRPAQIRFLTEGKALGAAIHKGWTATWNWVLSWVNHLKGGSGITVKNRHSGNPVLEVLIEGGDGIDVTCAGDGQPYVISATGVGGGDGGDDGGGGGGGQEDPEYYTPSISAQEMADGTHIFVDGADIATIPHGKTPVITASKSDKTTTISVDNVPLCTIEDGADGQDGDVGSGTEQEVVAGISFRIYNGKLQATVTKKKVKAITVADAASATVDVCDVSEITVVTGESYSPSSHEFTNTRKTVKIIGAASNADGQTPFTATPHSSE